MPRKPRPAKPPDPSPPPGLTIERVALDSLAVDPANARAHGDRNLDAIRGSLRQFGQVRPLAVQAGTNRIIAGNGTFAAMRSLGWDACDVVRLPMDDLSATAYGLADNRTAELAHWDTDVLTRLVGELRDDFDLGALGLGEVDMTEIADGSELGGLGGDRDAPPEDDPELDELPPLPVTPVTQVGDIWHLGNHVLMCGDSTDVAQVARLMGGERAHCVFTDPPYNVAGRTRNVASDVRDSYARLRDAGWDQDFVFASCEAALLSCLADDATVYVTTSHHLAGDIWAWMDRWADFHSYCVWDKPNPMPSLRKRHWTWSTEIVCYATRGKHTFRFPEEGHARNVWPLAKNRVNDLHPTMKPVAVPEHAIYHSSKPGDVVADLFGGAGSTLLACERLGRRARVMELSPAYVDVIVKRWEGFTGNEARRHEALPDDVAALTR